MAPPKSGELLARVNFPLYSINAITERHVLVAGGGGKSRTGIPNKIEIYELVPTKTTCKAEPVTRYPTGDCAIMNSTVFFHKGRKSFALAAGADEHCQMYTMRYCLLEDCREEDGDTRSERDRRGSSTALRRRRRSESTSSSKDHGEGDRPDGKVENGTANGVVHEITESAKSEPDKNANSVRIGFSIRPDTSFQTDFSTKQEPFQKVVRFAPETEVLFTGGADGCLRAWKYPQYKMIYKVQAHEDELDDLCISTDENKVVTVSRDGHGYVWDALDGKQVCELTFVPPGNSSEKYIFRACRFGIVEGDKSNYRLFTISNAAVRKKPASRCYLTKWDLRRQAPEKIQATGTDVLSSLAVSEDGRFLGVGHLSGAVEVYIAFSLQRLYRAEHAHNIFVTGLEFLKSCDETRRLAGNYDASLISISVDNHIVAHHIPYPATMGFAGLLIVIVGVILVVYVLMDFYGF
ncbi:prolactin regulatory element-binding protein isoform X2 [Rhipicephalus sanguineus]|uniref:prolactin regulatory element-binding protein isoform X2 n=1 Tax=Rhipicephalus sanguineus TaxID=34632 RepID=UPI001893AAFE|nr:prolactin regulatory element-binding protein isoform X2 [Rhipicephalus sanguineus]